MCKCEWFAFTWDLHAIYMAIDTSTHNIGKNGEGEHNLGGSHKLSRPQVIVPLTLKVACIFWIVIDIPSLSKVIKIEKWITFEPFNVSQVCWNKHVKICQHWLCKQPIFYILTRGNWCHVLIMSKTLFFKWYDL
jgi:hypothetical protein